MFCESAMRVVHECCEWRVSGVNGECCGTDDVGAA